MFADTKAYFRKLGQPTSKDSVKSFAMLISIGCGVFLTLCLGISLLIDVCKDGRIDSDMVGMAAETTAIGAMIGLSSISKTLVDRAKIKREENLIEEPVEEN